jgi:hypothetical protein
MATLIKESDAIPEVLAGHCHVVERRAREFYAAKIIKRRQLPHATHSSPPPEKLDAFLLKSNGIGR